MIPDWAVEVVSLNLGSVCPDSLTRLVHFHNDVRTVQQKVSKEKPVSATEYYQVLHREMIVL